MTKYIFIFIFIVLFAKEYIYINEEFLFIFSFLLFTYLVYFFVGSTIGQLLDNTSDEIRSKVKEIFLLRKTLLQETKQNIATVKGLEEKLIPLLLFTLHTIERRENLLLSAQRNSFEKFLELKLRELILESNTISTSFYTVMLEEAFDKAERKKI